RLPKQQSCGFDWRSVAAAWAAALRPRRLVSARWPAAERTRRRPDSALSPRALGAAGPSLRPVTAFRSDAAFRGRVPGRAVRDTKLTAARAGDVDPADRARTLLRSKLVRVHMK